jgi:CAAX prenyl protease-like protein
LRLIGSAFVIAPAEELFFRAYLYRRLQSEEWRSVDRRRFDWSAFLWTTGLFAVEHNRIVAAVMAGVFYLFVYRRYGLFAAALAHVVTNLLLALFVLYSGAWSFW